MENKVSNVNQKKVGLVFGKFAPLTEGHVSFIIKSANQVDTLYLFLSYDQKFIDSQPEWIRPKLSLTDRYRDLLDVVKQEELGNVVVGYVDESDIPSYPEGSAAYAELIREKIPEGVTLTHAFSSEPEYEAYFSEFFPEVNHVVIDADRKEVPISATMIRNSPYQYRQYLAEPARKRFVKKVAIIGVESTGKTTMTKRLARTFDTCWLPEVGRIICERDFHSSEFVMNREDYLNIAMEHRTKETTVQDWANGVMFSDTTNLITHFSAICAGKARPNDDMLMALDIEEGNNFYDMVLFLSPEVPWVSDPLRGQDTPEKRKETHSLLVTMVRAFYNPEKVVIISGKDYEDRFQQAVKAVYKLLEEK